MTIEVLAVVAIMLAIVLLKNERENFGYCVPDDKCSRALSKEGTLVINPYMWPYSGTTCIDDLYAVNKMQDDMPPLTSLSAPDHVVLTN